MSHISGRSRNSLVCLNPLSPIRPYPYNSLLKWHRPPLPRGLCMHVALCTMSVSHLTNGLYRRGQQKTKIKVQVTYTMYLLVATYLYDRSVANHVMMIGLLHNYQKLSVLAGSDSAGQSDEQELLSMSTQEPSESAMLACGKTGDTWSMYGYWTAAETGNSILASRRS